MDVWTVNRSLAFLGVLVLAVMVGADTSTQPPNNTEVINTDTHDKVDKVKKLRVITMPDRPFVMLSSTNVGQWQGLAIDILNEAVKNIDYDSVEIKGTEDNSWGYMDDKGNWNGMIGALVNGTADIAVGALSIHSNRANYIHFTQPFMQAGYRVLYKVPDAWFPSEAVVTVLRPFTPGLWVLLVLMFAIASVALYLIGRYSPFEDTAFVGKAATYEGLTLPNSMLYIFSSMVLQGYTAAPKSISGRILTCVWWVFTVFTVGSYIAGLCVILFRVNPEIRTLPFTTMEEMTSQSKVRVMLQKDSLTHRYFAHSQDRLEAKIYGQIREFPHEYMVESIQEGIDKMMKSNGKLALLMEGPMAEYISTQEPCDKMVIGEPLGHSAYAFACRNTSDVCNKMDAEILNIKENGNFSVFKNRWFNVGCLADKPSNYIYHGLPFFDTFGGEPDLIMPLTITVRRFSAAFIILLLGIVAAAICLAVEIYWAKRRGTSVPRKLERSGIDDDDMERIDQEYRDERA